MVFSVGDKKEVGRYIRHNWTYEIDVLADCLYYEAFYQSDQCMAPHDPDEDLDTLFDLPKSLLDIFTHRQNNGDDLFSDYRITHNIHHDLQYLTDVEVFNLMEQDCKYSDPMSDDCFYYTSTWKVF
jgi:hypothetical protein